MNKKGLVKTIFVVFAVTLVLAVSTGCPGEINEPVRTVKVAAGSQHTVLLKSDGTVWVAGRNNYGQLGLSGMWSRYGFTQVPDVSGIVDVSAGDYHTVLLKNDGTVWVTGANGSGRLGLGYPDGEHFGFVQVPGLAGVVSVGAGSSHTVVLKRDGMVWGTGDNGSSQLGMGDGEVFDGVTSFTALPGISSGKRILAGGYYTLVLKDDGTLWGTGSNSSGQLGLGETPTHQYTFIPLSITDIKDISAGLFHTVMVKNDGTVWAAGENDRGQLGLGDNVNRSIFTEVSGITGVDKVATGSNCTFIILNDGRIYATGWNAYGQLGLGDTNNRNTYEIVAGISDVTMIASGGTHTILLRSDGTVWSVGDNRYGQLGIGSVIGPGN